MDTLTHIATGACIGGLTAGKKTGWKAAAWGGFFGYFPDIDVIIGIFLTDMQALAFHRGITHSILFACIMPFLLALIPMKLHKQDGVPYGKWVLLIFLALMSHLLLDVITSYGTQLLQPFSNMLIYTANVSIIDPLFSLPLLFAAIFGFLKRPTFKSKQRVWTAALILAVLYTSWTFYNKQHVSQVFERSLNQQDINYESYTTKPSLFNNILWRGIARTNDGYYTGYYSLLDEHQEVALWFKPRHDTLLDDFAGTVALDRLYWFADGYYSADKKGEGHVLFHNLRFGKTAGWDENTPSNYAFTYEIRRDAEGGVKVRRVPLDVRDEGDRPSLRKLWERMRGK